MYTSKWCYFNRRDLDMAIAHGGVPMFIYVEPTFGAARHVGGCLPTST